MTQDTTSHRSEILCDTLSANEHIASWFQSRYGSDELSAISELPATLERGMTVAVCTYKRPASLDRFLESLSRQDRTPDQLMIVDASPDEETEQVVRAHATNRGWSSRVLYFRVTGPLAGLTHQRNFALRWVSTELVGFFDDDVTLHTRCLTEMEKACLSSERIVGVGAAIENVPLVVPWSIRFQRIFGIIPGGQRGRYHRSGFQSPWYPLPDDEEVLEGDYVHGCGMMWKTIVARNVGFFDGFDGYSLGEDLEFSVRMQREGKLVMACRAQLKHLHEDAGRPDARQHGYMVIHNALHIHRQAFPDRTWNDVLWFAYGWTLETIFYLRSLLFPRRIKQTIQHVLGRAQAVFDIISRRPRSSRS